MQWNARPYVACVWLTSLEVCRDEEGTITISAPPTGNGLLVSLSRVPDYDPACSCQSRLQQMQQAGAMRFDNTLPSMQFMPRLELPDEGANAPALPTRFFGSGGFSSSGSEVETEASTRTGMNLAELLEHFADQLRNQGWEAEFAGSGAATA